MGMGMAAGTVGLRVAYSSLRLVSLYSSWTQRHLLFPPILGRTLPYYPARARTSSFACSVISGDERTSPEKLKSKSVGEFRKKLRIAEIKGGAEEGLERLGESVVVKGWVRTLRLQSTVSFIEVNTLKAQQLWNLNNYI